MHGPTNIKRENSNEALNIFQIVTSVSYCCNCKQSGVRQTTACKLILKSLHRKTTEEIAWNSKRLHGPVFERMVMTLIVVAVDDFNLVHVGSLQCLSCAHCWVTFTCSV